MMRRRERLPEGERRSLLRLDRDSTCGDNTDTISLHVNAKWYQTGMRKHGSHIKSSGVSVF